MGSGNSAPFGLDLNNLPSWISLVVLTVYVFRQQIGSFVPTAVREHFRNRARRQADREEFEQELAISEVNHQLQTKTAEHLAAVHREERLVALLEKKDGWIQNALSKELACLMDGQNRTNELLGEIHDTLVEIKVRGNG